MTLSKVRFMYDLVCWGFGLDRFHCNNKKSLNLHIVFGWVVSTTNILTCKLETAIWWTRFFTCHSSHTTHVLYIVCTRSTTRPNTVSVNTQPIRSTSLLLHFIGESIGDMAARILKVIIKPIYTYVSRIGPISGHMTLTIATFPSTTPKIHRAR